jgi:hypothetical protein
LLGRGCSIGLCKPPPQVVDGPPLVVEFPLEDSQPAGEPDLPEQGNNREHGDPEADEREEQRNHVHKASRGPIYVSAD